MLHFMYKLLHGATLLMLHGLLHLSVWGYILAITILTQITIASITLYLHRCQAHRALDFHPIISHFFRFWLWLTTGMRTKDFAAVHRKHHARCETAEDPHSPQVLGLAKVLWEGAELYQVARDDKETLERFGYGTPDDWIERHVYTPHNGVGISLMFLIDVLLFGPIGITIWALQMMWTPFFAAGVVNGIGHYWGYRNYECPDAARNIVPWGFFIGGEELHNNHHTFGSSAKFSSKWWEFDIGWFYICILRKLKLATVKKIAPELTLEKDKHTIDTETLKALILNRFQIMSCYSKEVILPVFNEEKCKAGEKGRKLFAHAKSLLIRETSLIDAENKQRLARLLSERQTLNLVYQFRMKLQDIWYRTSASQKELLEALQEWCSQAELTGILVLMQFADHLKGFKSVTVAT